jgi:hypothetical protein
MVVLTPGADADTLPDRWTEIESVAVTTLVRDAELVATADVEAVMDTRRDGEKLCNGDGLRD